MRDSVSSSLYQSLLRVAAGLVLITAVLAVSGTAVAAAKGKKPTTETTTPGPDFSSASGTVAAVSMATSSIEVQNPAVGQVTVSWTPTTTFSQPVTVPSTQLAEGDCVTVASSKTKKNAPLAATTVVLQPSVGGSCARLFSRANGPKSPGPGGLVGTGPVTHGTFHRGGFPQGRSGSTRFQILNSHLASGQVISISGSTFEVKGVVPVPATHKSKAERVSKRSKERPGVKLKTVRTKVTFSPSTQFTMVEPASASNLAVGVCATALGPADQTGAITASTISLHPAPPSGCTGFPGFPGSFKGRGA